VPVIELEDVSIAFGDRKVLDGLNLTIYSGETTFIVGRSGSGKTVLLKLMLRLLVPDRGRIRLFGHDLESISETELVELRRRTGMLFQNYALFDALDVEDNIEFPLRETVHASRGEAARLAHELIDMLGLTGSEHVLPGELSGGMRRRVGLARALASHPELTVLDEPTTGLDPLMVERVDEIMAEAKQRYGGTTIVVSHDLASTRRLADRIAFLHDGKIIFTGTYDELVHCELAPVREFVGGSVTAHAHDAPPPGRPVIELVSVRKQFGDKEVLRGVDLAIYPRRITGLIGVSGSGKSVIVKHVMGLVRPDSGKVLVFGKDLATLSERQLAEVRTHIGLVFQHAALLDWLDVGDNVAFPLVERRVPARERRARADEIVERLGLAALRHHMPGELSVGERKRVGLARAMVMRPDILIYDEPTTGQEPPRVREIDEMIVQTQEQFGVTTLVISHDMESTFRIAHTVAMIHEGRIVAFGTPGELLASANAQVHRFLHASALR
jgi:ABC-type transporter Mla maintaining outer membrane lipid asymmetry ATPase subunit MlaF